MTNNLNIDAAIESAEGIYNGPLPIEGGGWKLESGTGEYPDCDFATFELAHGSMQYTRALHAARELGVDIGDNFFMALAGAEAAGGNWAEKFIRSYCS